MTKRHETGHTERIRKLTGIGITKENKNEKSMNGHTRKLIENIICVHKYKGVFGAYKCAHHLVLESDDDAADTSSKLVTAFMWFLAALTLITPTESPTAATTAIKPVARLQN